MGWGRVGSLESIVSGQIVVVAGVGSRLSEWRGFARRAWPGVLFFEMLSEWGAGFGSSIVQALAFVRTML